MMRSAALLVTANNEVETATTAGAQHYYMGVRDAFECMFRWIHEYSGDDAVGFARAYLATIPAGTRTIILDESRSCLRARRSESISDRVALVSTSL